MNYFGSSGNQFIVHIINMIYGDYDARFNLVIIFKMEDFQQAS